MKQRSRPTSYPIFRSIFGDWILVTGCCCFTLLVGTDGTNESKHRAKGMRPISETKILVVDDYREMISIIRRMLLRFGFKDVDDADDSLSALVKLRDRTYDLVISDMIMEPMDGLGLLREIRADAALRALPLIMVTASPDERDIIAAIEAGVTAYILKPFTAALLRQRVDGALAAQLGGSPMARTRVARDGRDDYPRVAETLVFEAAPVKGEGNHHRFPVGRAGLRRLADTT
jgi:two-component system chemotaxis response regulator CheY